MYVVYGKGLYGTVDKVPGFFSIGTRFFHIYYAPLFPLGSFIVLKKEGKAFSGVPIPMQMKSVMMAYGVGFLPLVWVVAGLITAIVATESTKTGAPLIPAGIGIFAFCLWLIVLTLSIRGRASYQRACQMGVIAGLSESGWQRLNLHFGRQGSGPLGV